MVTELPVPKDCLAPAVDVVRASDETAIVQALGDSISRKGLEAQRGSERIDPLVIKGSLEAAYFVGEKLIDYRSLRVNKAPMGVAETCSDPSRPLLKVSPPEELSGMFEAGFKREWLASDLVADWRIDAASEVYHRIRSWLRPIKEVIAPTVPVELTDWLWAYEDGSWSKVKGATYIGGDGLSVIILAASFEMDLESVLYREMVVAHRADGRIKDDEWSGLRRWLATCLAASASAPSDPSGAH